MTNSASHLVKNSNLGAATQCGSHLIFLGLDRK